MPYEITSHSVTCHPAEVTFPPLPQPKLVLDLATTEGCKAELTWDAYAYLVDLCKSNYILIYVKHNRFDISSA